MFVSRVFILLATRVKGCVVQSAGNKLSIATPFYCLALNWFTAVIEIFSTIMHGSTRALGKHTLSSICASCSHKWSCIYMYARPLLPWPGSRWAVTRYWAAARELGMPAIMHED